MKYVLFPILYLCLIPVYFMLRNETKPKKNIILGVTLPLLAQSDPRVGDIVRRFKRNVWLCTGAMALIFAALAFRGTSLCSSLPCCRSRCSRSSAHPFSLRSASSGSSLR